MGLFSTIRSLLGGGEPVAALPKQEPAEAYKGFSIIPAPQEEEGQFRVAAIIRMGEREHRFIRSDLLSSRQDCIEITLLKARRTIDEQGEGIFG